MKLSRVKCVLSRRLSLLRARVGAERPGTVSHVGMSEEAEALDTILRCQGMLDEGEIERGTATVVARVLPSLHRRSDITRRAVSLHDETGHLVHELQRVARVA